MQRWSCHEEDREYCHIVSECRLTTRILRGRTTHTKGTGPFVWEVMNRGILDTGGHMTYLISDSQRGAVEEDDGCRKLMILVMGLTQGLKGDENGAYVDRVPGD